MNASLARAENPLKPDVGAKDGSKPHDSENRHRGVCHCNNKESAYHHKAVGSLE